MLHQNVRYSWNRRSHIVKNIIALGLVLAPSVIVVRNALAQTAQAEGPNAAMVKWPEGDSLPAYQVTSDPPAPNQPVSFQAIASGSLQDRMIYQLKPSTQYVFTICASDGPCIKTNPIVTYPEQTGAGDTYTPMPTIINSYVTTDSITIWSTSDKNYLFYHTRLEVGQPPQSGDFGGGYAGAIPLGPPNFFSSQELSILSRSRDV